MHEQTTWPSGEQSDRPTSGSNPGRASAAKRPWWAPKWGRRSSGMLGLFHLLVASVLATAWVEGGRTDTLLLVVVIALVLQAAYDLAIWVWQQRARRAPPPHKPPKVQSSGV